MKSKELIESWTARFLGLPVVFVFVINLIASVALLYGAGRDLLFGLMIEGMNAQIINFDFGSFWVAGQLIRAGEIMSLFGHDNYFQAAQSILGSDYRWHSWSYPPHIFLLLWPLGFMSLKSGLLAYLITGFALFFAGIRKIVGPEVSKSPLFWAMLMPLVALNAVSTQGGFLEMTMPFMTVVMTQGTGIFTFMMPTFFISLRVLGWPYDSALSAQMYISMAMLTLYFWMATRRQDIATQGFLLAAFTFLITPYAFNYDMGAVVVLALAVWFAASQTRDGVDRSIQPASWPMAIAIWALSLLPVLVTSLGLAGYPVGPLVILMVVGVLFLAGGALREAQRPLPG